MLETAVLLLLFNRPNTTKQVFESIRQAKPSRLYIAGDGPRVDYDSDKEKIRKTREIISKVDWACDIKTLFRDENLGCKQGVSSAITWFFEQEKQGIILEDDCVPHLDFFSFCENLLNRYSEDHRVSVITGDNFQNGKWRGDGSYYFSKYNHCWGWASWNRAWKNYQGDINFWPEWKNSIAWKKFMPDKVERIYWEKIFDKVYEGGVDSWAYPWLASTWFKGSLTATPNVNLVSNIGFGEGATHTKSKNDKNSNMETSSLKILKHTNIIERNIKADNWTFNYHYEGKKLRFIYKWIFFPYRVFKYFMRKINLA